MPEKTFKKNTPGAYIGLLMLLILAFLPGSDLGCAPVWAQKYGRPVIPENPNLLRQQAFDCYLAGEFEDAAELYKRAIDSGIQQYGQNSTFVADIYYELGTMSLEEGNFTRASRYLPLAVKAKPNSIQARVKLADLYLMQDKAEQAMAEVATALKNNPGSVEAQRELVKLMMARAGSSAEDSAAANLACTWEAFQLKNFSNNVLKNTNTLIAQWQQRIKSGGNNLPRLSVAMLNSANRTPPQKQESAPAAAPVATKIKPPQKPTPKPVVSKPRVTRTAAKPVAKPVAKSVPKPVSEPKSTPAPKVIVKQTTVERPAKRSNGMVPPPPPMVPPPIFAPPPSSIKLETHVQVKKETKEKTEKKEPPKKVKKPAVPDEPDFILDWAAPKKSKPSGGD